MVCAISCVVHMLVHYILLHLLAHVGYYPSRFESILIDVFSNSLISMILLTIFQTYPQPGGPHFVGMLFTHVSSNSMIYD